jgi:hypothetical protein
MWIISCASGRPRPNSCPSAATRRTPRLRRSGAAQARPILRRASSSLPVHRGARRDARREIRRAATPSFAKAVALPDAGAGSVGDSSSSSIAVAWGATRKSARASSRAPRTAGVTGVEREGGGTVSAQAAAVRRLPPSVPGADQGDRSRRPRRTKQDPTSCARRTPARCAWWGPDAHAISASAPASSRRSRAGPRSADVDDRQRLSGPPGAARRQGSVRRR